MTVCVLLAALVGGIAPEFVAAQPVSTDAARQVSNELGELLAKVPAGTQVGLVVADAENGMRWFEHAPHQPLKPASVLKLLVTATALHRFGDDFEYTTRLYVHDGELWVIGAGDPGLGDERIARRHGLAVNHLYDEWADALRSRGITRLSSIVLDDSIFERQWRHPDWPIEQSHAWYQAPVGGLNYNDNCVDASVRLSNGRITLRLQPPLPASFVNSELTTSGKHKPAVTRRPDQDVFHFTGGVRKNAALGPTSVRRPTVIFGYALQMALQERGIEVDPTVVRREITAAAIAEATPLATHTTSIRDVLWRCNTYSQNLFAECLLKSLAAYNADGSRSGNTGGWELGTQVVRATLSSLGVDLAHAELRDGSGLSHQNRLTAEQILQLLVVMHKHPQAAAFVESLAAAGEDGTMRRRFKDPLFQGRLRGKTGTLNGVHTLAGYVSRTDGTTLAFALLVNGPGVGSLRTDVCRVLVGSGDG